MRSGPVRPTEMWSVCPRPPLLVQGLLSPACTWSRGEPLRLAGRGREGMSQLTGGPAQFAAPPSSGRPQLYSPSLGHCEGQWSGKILPRGRTAGCALGCSLGLEGKLLGVRLFVDSRGVAMVWLGGRGLGRDIIGELMARMSGD